MDEICNLITFISRTVRQLFEKFPKKSRYYSHLLSSIMWKHFFTMYILYNFTLHVFSSNLSKFSLFHRILSQYTWIYVINSPWYMYYKVICENWLLKSVIICLQINKWDGLIYYNVNIKSWPETRGKMYCKF